MGEGGQQGEQPRQRGADRQAAEDPGAGSCRGGRYKWPQVGDQGAVGGQYDRQPPAVTGGGGQGAQGQNHCDSSGFPDVPGDRQGRGGGRERQQQEDGSETRGRPYPGAIVAVV